jgi:hypothetical protein
MHPVATIMANLWTLVGVEDWWPMPTAESLITVLTATSKPVMFRAVI